MLIMGAALPAIAIAEVASPVGAPVSVADLPSVPASVTAPVVILRDLSSGAVLAERDADRRIPPASMAKMMTVYSAFRLIAAGELSLDHKFRVRPETWAKWHGPNAGSTMFLSADSEVTVRDLLRGIVTVSGNDACVVLAEGIDGSEAAFVARMNRDARRLGLAGSRFGTSNGWPDEGATYVTARDLATLAERTVRDFPKLYKTFHGSPEMRWEAGGKVITQPNRNPLLGRVAGADGVKTGHTDEAGYGFTGSAEQQGRRLVMVVAGIDSYAGREAQSIDLMTWGFSAWRGQPLLRAGHVVTSAPVQGGADATVSLVARQSVGATLPAGSEKKVAVTAVFDGPLRAPIAKGEPVGHLVVTPEGLAPQITPLVAAASVPLGGPFDRILAGAQRLVGR